MHSIEERLKRLMGKGFDIHIECKGVGRNYAMSYEATVKRSSPNQSDKSGFSWLVVQAHAVGETLDEVVDELENRLKDN